MTETFDTSLPALTLTAKSKYATASSPPWPPWPWPPWPGGRRPDKARATPVGMTSNTLVRSSQSSSGPAGGASDGYELGRGAAGPDHQCTTTAAGTLRVIV